ncbi:MAG: DUF6220 domain-containing protein [Phycisphaerales bacterium]
MRTIGPALTCGFTIAASMWCIWFLLHLPGVNTSPALQGSLIFAGMCVAGFTSGRRVRVGRRVVLVGALSGLIAAGINVMVLGSYLTQATPLDPNAPDAAAQASLHPSTPIVLLGFTALSMAVAALTVTMGSATRYWRRENVQAADADWHARFSVVLAVLIMPLLLIGAAVTSTGSGLAVPDWPGTYGANMVMYPIGLMTRPRIVIEHGHRLFGMLIGLTTLVLMLLSVCGQRPRFVKVWAVGLLLLVGLQGYLGGQRVVQTSAVLGVIHGVTAQLFFALAVAYAVVVSPLFRSLGHPELARHRYAWPPLSEVAGTGLDAALLVRRLKVFAAAATHSLILQLILGALYRHLRQPHALWAHIGFSVVVVIAASAGGFIAVRLGDALRSEPLRRTIKRLGTGMVAVVFLQFLLGWLAFWVVQTTERSVTPFTEATTAPQVPVHAALIPTIHQANGAVLFALAAMMYAWSIRFKRLPA